MKEAENQVRKKAQTSPERVGFYYENVSNSHLSQLDPSGSQ